MCSGLVGLGGPGSAEATGIVDFSQYITNIPGMSQTLDLYTSYRTKKAQIAGQREAEIQQYQSQLAQQEITRRQYEDEAQAKAANAIVQYQQLQIAQQERNEAAVMEKMDINREMDKARSLAQLSAMEGGVGGNVVARINADLGFTQGQRLAAVESSRVSEIGQLQAAKLGAHMSAYQGAMYTYTGKTTETRNAKNKGPTASRFKS